MLIKLLSATAILGVAIAGAYLLIPANVPGTPATSTNSNEIQQKIIGRSPRVESLKDNSDLSATAQQIISTAPITDQNLTDTLIQKIQADIREKNQSGPQIVEGEATLTATEPDILVQQILDNATSDFNPQNLRPVITNASINISNTDTSAAFISYLKKFDVIVAESAKLFPKILLGDPSKITDSGVLDQVIQTYQTTFDAFLKLEVPSALVLIHKKELELTGTKINIFKVMKNASNDPLAALLAAGELETITNSFIDLQKEIMAFIQTNHLEI